MTSLAEERAEQARWKPRADRAALPEFAVFGELVENEFLSPEAGARAEASALGAIIAFAAGQVPYYRRLFERVGLDAREIRDRRDLPRLPVLTREALRGNARALLASALPAGTVVAGVASSSGSTGPPAEVVHTAASNAMFTFLNQRQSRWFRRDPALKLAAIRNPASLPRPRPGEFPGNGETLRAPRWRYVGAYFETGPGVYYSVLDPVEAQVEWLRRERPDYLISRSHSLEHIVMGAGGERPCPSLKAVTAISEALTPAAREHLAAALGAPVQLAYGLNEIGLVAACCEAGRYHVHREHCIVEIVDEAGSPVAPGSAGRLVVTGLTNYAMPLIRYDSDDLVTAVDGPCACGRTLPSFGEVHGRHSRIMALPPGTLERVEAVRAALWTMPPSLARNLRRYQIHQFRDGSFELRLAAAGVLPPAFGLHIERLWRAGAGAGGPRLALAEVGEIPIYTARDKFDDFVSEFAEWPRRPAGTES
ncbi:MAG: phenylacetate--CoA ligase family protein [Burkholderiales bacterium]|nr:phenylacetate--CoA ligase family protein [Burkholderiales bacterium]